MDWLTQLQEGAQGQLDQSYPDWPYHYYRGRAEALKDIIELADAALSGKPRTYKGKPLNKIIWVVFYLNRQHGRALLEEYKSKLWRKRTRWEGQKDIYKQYFEWLRAQEQDIRAAKYGLTRDEL
jgi:hypothetical protein